MDCVACGLPGAYNRAVVDTVSDDELGVLCPECERAHFGRRLANGDWRDGECACCDRDGFVALPAWRAYVVETDGRRVARSEYSLAEPTPALCDRHAERLVGDASPVDAGPDERADVPGGSD